MTRKLSLPPKGPIDEAWRIQSWERYCAGESLRALDQENPRWPLEDAFDRWRWHLRDFAKWGRIERERRSSEHRRDYAPAARNERLDAMWNARRYRARFIDLLDAWNRETARRDRAEFDQTDERAAA